MTCAWGSSMLLDSTSLLEFSVDSGTAVEFVAGAQNDSGTAITGVFNSGTSNGTTPVTLIAAPASSNVRRVLYVCIRNADTASRTVTVRVDVSGTDREVRSLSLGVGEALEYAAPGWRVLDASGREKLQTSESSTAPGTVRVVQKTGTAAEAAASWYGFAKDAGAPGAWVPGTPGLNGAVVTAPFDGALPLGTPASGTWTLVDWLGASSVACTLLPFDLLWYNTGIVVTTTTAQAITTPTFPARDVNGSSDGAGLMIGLYWTAASTNAAAIAGSTVTYTNSDGVGSRTATLIATAGNQIPATPVIGTIVWFRLAAGDKGVRSIQSVTLTTSLVTGSVSLFVARWLPMIPAIVANAAPASPRLTGGVRVWSGSAIFFAYLATATTALTFSATMSFEDR